MTLVPNDGTKFGYRNPNGSLTGALKNVQSRKSDIAFVGFFIKDYETRDVEFTSPIYSDELCIVVKDFAIYTSFDYLRQDALDVLGARDYFG